MKSVAALLVQRMCGVLVLLCAANAAAEKPTFDCSKKDLHAVEVAICGDPALGALDREFDAVYRQALAVDRKAVHGTLPAEQRGWISGRNECWKERDIKACTTKAYNRRISELQARYRLLSPASTVSYYCDKNPAHELVVHYFSTKIRVAVVEHGDDTFFLFDDSGGSGDRYLGRNETLTIKDGPVQFVPAYQAPALMCEPRTQLTRRMHPSWDKDGDGINDCEKEGLCDDSVDYTAPRP